MENSPRLYSELVALCGQAGQWRDVRHVQTMAWMVVGLIQAGWSNLTAWVPFVHGRARYAQSTQRRFRRWLGTRRLEVAPLYGPLIQQALQEGGKHTVYLALDTSLLWNQYCLIRLSVVYRGRAVPLFPVDQCSTETLTLNRCLVQPTCCDQQPKSSQPRSLGHDASPVASRTASPPPQCIRLLS
jgi:hypothetical protein